MSFYNNTEITDLTMDIDSDHDNSSPPQSFPELISSPNSIYIYPIHEYASQRLNNSNPIPSSSPSPKKFKSKASKVNNTKYKYEYKSMKRKPQTSIGNSLKDFIVNDDEIDEIDEVEEEEEIVKGSTFSVKKYPELILDHKYDNDQLLYLVKWDNLSNSWENVQTINDATMVSAYWEERKRKKRSIGQSSTQSKRRCYNSEEEYNDDEHDNENSDSYELINKYPNAIAYSDPGILIDWNEEIDEIESIQHNNSDQLLAYVLWKSGLRSVHLLDELHEKAPKKMCKWYSVHLKFLDNENLQNWY